MSVDFTQPPSPASIPDASETVKGKIRIATSAEATAGTDDLTAMTPLKVQSVVNTALVGGVTYQGTFDASSPADLSNASKGDLYIISVAGTYQGQTWAVGDHLLINADMGGTLDPAKIDKVDNTDAVTSVAGRTGAVTLSTADISGLATVASTGAYSDLTGAPTNVSSFTNDAGYLTDITGEAIGDLSDVDVTGVSNNDVLVYNSTSGNWEAGTSPAPSIALNDLTDVTITGAATGEVLRYDGANWVDAQLAYSDLSGTPTLATVATTGAYSDLSGTPTNVSTFTNDAGYLTDITGENLGDLSDVDVTGVSNGDVIAYNSTSGNWEATAQSGAPAASETVAGILEIATNAEATAGVAVNKALVPSNISSITTAQLDNSAGTMLEAANNLSDLNDAGIARTNLSLGTAAVEDTGTSTGNLVKLIDVSGSPGFPAVDGSNLTNLPPSPSFYTTTVTSTSTATQITTNRRQHYNVITGGITLTIPSAGGTAAGGIVTVRNAATTAISVSVTNVTLIDGTVTTSFNVEPKDDRTFVWLSTSVLAEVAATRLEQLGDVSITGATTGEVLRYNGTSWVDAQLAYSDLSGTPTLATVATTGAYSDLSGTPTNVSTFTNDAGYLTDITGENLGDLADVDLTGLADGEIIIYNATSGNWEANPPPAPAATETSAGLIEIATNAEATAGTATDKALVPSNISSITTAQLDNSAGTMLEAANNLSDLANAATARTNLGLGTAAVENTGTSTGNLVKLIDVSGSPGFPVLDGSNLTGVVADISGASIGDLSDVTITAATTGEVLRYDGANWVDAQLTLDDLSDVSYPASPTKDQLLQWNSTSSKWEPVDATTVTSATPGSTYSVTTHKGLEEVYILSPSTTCTVSIPTATTAGEGFKYQFKLMTANAMTINETIDGVSGFTISNQYSSATIVSDGSAWYLI